MNIYKKQDIVAFVRRQGKLPTDQFGQILSVDDLMSWFELNECLDRYEQEIIKKELAALVDAQQSMEKLRLMEQSRTNISS